MNSYVSNKVKQLLHWTVDVTVPNNEFIAAASAGAGFLFSRYIDVLGHEAILKFHDYMYDNNWTYWFEQSGWFEKSGWVYGASKKGSAMYWVPIFKDYAMSYGSIAAGLTTSVILNLVAQKIFKKIPDKKDEEAIKLHANQWGLSAALSKFEDLRLPLKQANKQDEANPTLTEPIQNEKSLDKPQNQNFNGVKDDFKSSLEAHAPVFSVNDPYEDVLDEEIHPCCGEIFGGIKKIWENDKPDSVSQLNVDSQSFV